MARVAPVFRAFPVIFALLLAACPHVPIDFGPRGRITDPALALESVRARRAAMKRVQGEAKTSLETSDGSGRITQYVIAEAPDRLHIESLSFFNNPVSVLATDGAQFELFDLEHKRFWSGPATPGNLARFVQVQVPANELVSLVLGVPPLADSFVTQSLDVDEQARAYVLHLGRDGERELIGLEPATLRPKFVAFDARPGLSAYKAELDDYEGKADLPRTVRVATDSAKIELTWKDRELDPEIDPAVFTLTVPEGVEHVQVR